MKLTTLGIAIPKICNQEDAIDTAMTSKSLYPPQVSPEHVVQTLQTFEPLLDNHNYVINYRPKSGTISHKDLAVVKGDSFFEHDRHDLDPELSSTIGAPDSRWWICDVWEDVYWVPFIIPYFSRLKRYLAIGCKTTGGIRFRQSVSGGVVTRGTFTVVERQTGRPWAPRARESARGGNTGLSENWDGDTEKGSIISNTENGREGENESESGNPSSRGDEKGPSNWDAADDTDAEFEPTWDIVCECEIEMPLILIMSQILRRDANRQLCEHLCRSLIYATVAEHDEYRILDSDLAAYMEMGHTM
ncbi:hypothetical protein NUW58_g8304 [Xylaria curta]|uniref:Uncharacterized protein n=1 Tax=Xylaria curta TaxID=42375 RepID=A0ACC1NAY0_9PEZI|nr:hypothetical protein NUW58_g8304 [Xylaria curta]